MVLRQVALPPGRRRPRLSPFVAATWLLGAASALAQPAPVPPAAVPAPGAAPAPADAPPAPEPAKAPAPEPAALPPQPTPEPARETAPDPSRDAPKDPPKDTPKKASRALPPLVLAKISQDPTPTLAPSTFLDTLRMADRYQAIVQAGGWPGVPANLSLKPGDRNPAVALLRRRLAVTEDLAADAPASDVMDEALVAALKRFQQRHGLPDTGLLGPMTVKALNVPASTRQRQLAASASRLMGSRFPFGERYVVANIPSATVEAVERGTVARRYVAVVGKPDRASPLVETRITNVNFNPTWTVPVSLIKKDIIPHMRKDPGYLAKMHIRMLDGQGNEVQPTAIDWSTEKAVNYTLRQDPGFDNSLGQVRIDMPNRHAVYMHDTPSKNLFSRTARFHSSGCVRVAEVKGLVGWLLEGTPGPGGPGTVWGPMEIETGIATGERRDIKLAKPVPVTFVYLTGYATPDGRAHFRDDVYSLDGGSPAPGRPEPDVAATASIAPKPSPKPWPKPAAGRATASTAAPAVPKPATAPKAPPAASAPNPRT
ncbi:L,D-transpeptidase family protein [Methylobacterium nodulans]|uniref:ErfK/YbiS/YcfS/YnhG family protein n=1 Tax=Methylobacterium nodulans (strain LMG 21967 / CNCM I-2342 / ORS 2060) TaxID=460265 RepID=B8IEG8_METNO|nr:L,D-transpeptidase family protein [Methylobacterium nodulans]ACL59540.1 ErfK/YbiS/YcfS/YnhG family protein [Methylobacterium nodulans ORS 2060]